MVGARESPQQAAPVSRPSAIGVLSMGIWRSWPQTDVHLGRLQATNESATATAEAVYLSNLPGKRQSRGRDHAGRFRASLLRGESMIDPPADAAREARPPLELGQEEKNDEKVARVDGRPKSACLLYTS